MHPNAIFTALKKKLALSKILIVGPAYPLRGGLATYNERLAREFIQMGHSCHILSFSLQYPSFLFPGKTQYATDATPPPELHIESAINSINPINWIAVGQRIKKEHYDTVIFRYWLSFMAPALGTIARLIKSNNHTQILAITDNIIPHEQKFFDTAFTQFFLSACDGFLTMSQSVLAQLQQLKQHKPATYVPHPMYDMFGLAQSKTDARKRLNLNANDKVLLFFGFIRKYKGLHLLLEAMADQRIKNERIKLLVAGEFYEEEKPYLDQIKAMGLEDTVLLSNDFIPSNEVSHYFCAADMVVQTYLNATQSGVTQIAYFYDKPMLVTNVGGLAELVPDKKVGYVVEKNPQTIANAILDFYTNQREVAFVKNILVEKQQFTWKYLCEKLLTLAHESTH
jgi:D-inositol-3-phosphate glycosyltransferase